MQRMNQQITEITQKWIKLRTTQSKPTSVNNNTTAMIQIIKELNKIPLQKLQYMYKLLMRIKESQKIIKRVNHDQISCVPVVDLHDKTQELLKTGISFEEGLTKVLLKWFKHEFFSWVNALVCTKCGSERVDVVGAVQPTIEDLRYGASRVELHKCRLCSNSMKFPRYNDPLKLLETRRGRCGEWANAFTFIATFMGLEARYVLDMTDHVWTEIWIPEEKRWVHVDSCEEAFDSPLMYESGWGKNLNFIVSLNELGFIDVTPRYTRKLDQVMERRNIDESVFAQVLQRWTKECRKSLPEDYRQELISRDQDEEKELVKFSKETLDRRELKEEETKGRQSGSLLWRQARGEHE